MKEKLGRFDGFDSQGHNDLTKHELIFQMLDRKNIRTALAASYIVVSGARIS